MEEPIRVTVDGQEVERIITHRSGSDITVRITEPYQHVSDGTFPTSPDRSASLRTPASGERSSARKCLDSSSSAAPICGISARPEELFGDCEHTGRFLGELLRGGGCDGEQVGLCDDLGHVRPTVALSWLVPHTDSRPTLNSA